MWLRHFRHWTTKVAEFTAGRTPQPDDEFLAACSLPPGDKSVRMALAVRKVFGEEGSVDPRFILASDRFPEDLSILPFWDSIDLLDLVFKLEQELHIKITMNTLPYPRFTVREFVHGLLRSVRGSDGGAT